MNVAMAYYVKSHSQSGIKFISPFDFLKNEDGSFSALGQILFACFWPVYMQVHASMLQVMQTFSGRYCNLGIWGTDHID